MKTYELTYIVPSSETTQAAESINNDVSSLIQSKEGIILKSEKLGALPLSYPIRRQSSGYFNVSTFQVEEDKVKEIKDSLDKNSKILRSVIAVKKPAKEMKGGRARKLMFAKSFEIKKKPSIIEKILRKEPKKEEGVNVADLDKKLDELLGE